MSDNKRMFEDARVGDRVWEYRKGFTVITHIDDKDAYPIFAKSGQTYTLDGYLWEGDIYPSLLHDEIKFEIPPRPKRMVKKVLHGWVNIYENCTSRVHPTQEVASREVCSNVIACVEINQEYEVEE